MQNNTDNNELKEQVDLFLSAKVNYSFPSNSGDVISYSDDLIEFIGNDELVESDEILYGGQFITYKEIPVKYGPVSQDALFSVTDVYKFTWKDQNHGDECIYVKFDYNSYDGYYGYKYVNPVVKAAVVYE